MNKKILLICCCSFLISSCSIFYSTKNIKLLENIYKYDWSTYKVSMHIQVIKTMETSMTFKYLLLNNKFVNWFWPTNWWDNYDAPKNINEFDEIYRKYLNHSKLTHYTDPNIINLSPEGIAIYVDSKRFNNTEFKAIKQFILDNINFINNDLDIIWQIIYSNHEKNIDTYYCTWNTMLSIYEDQDEIEYNWKIYDNSWYRYWVLDNNNSLYIDNMEEKNTIYPYKVLYESRINLFKTCKNNKWKKILDMYNLKKI